MHSSSFWNSEILFAFTSNPNLTERLVGLIIIHCFCQHWNERASNELKNKDAKNHTQGTIIHI